MFAYCSTLCPGIKNFYLNRKTPQKISKKLKNKSYGNLIIKPFLTFIFNHKKQNKKMQKKTFTWKTINFSYISI